MAPTINQVFHPVYINCDPTGVFFAYREKCMHGIGSDLGRDPFNQNFRKFRSKTPVWSGPTKKVVHLLRWTRWTTFNRSDQGGKRLGGETMRVRAKRCDAVDWDQIMDHRPKTGNLKESKENVWRPVLVKINIIKWHHK